MFGRAGLGAAASAGFGAGFSGFGDIFDAFFGGTGAATGARHGRPAVGSDLRYDLRLTFEEAIHGLETEIEFPVLDRCATCCGQRREGRLEGDDLPAVPGPRRGSLGPPDDARPDDQRDRLPALQGRGSDHRGPLRDVPRRRPDRAAQEAAGRRSRPASTRATRSVSRARARPGRAAGPRAASTSRSTWRPIPSSSARARSSTTSSTSRSPRRLSACAPGCPRSMATRRSRSSRAPSRAPSCACAAGACPHLRRTGSKGDLHVFVRVNVPAQAHQGAAPGPRDVRGGVRRRGRARPQRV